MLDLRVWLIRCVCWLCDRTAGSTGEKHGTVSTTSRSVPEGATSQPSSKYSLSPSPKHHPSRGLQFANAGTTQTGHNSSQGNTSVCSNGTWELLLCSCSIGVLATPKSENKNLFFRYRQNKFFMLLKSGTRRPQLLVLICII